VGAGLVARGVYRFLSLVIATVLYALVVLSALVVMSPSELAGSSAPLADVFAKATGWSPKILAAIGLAAIVNGILVQLVMGSRIVYGLASQGWIPRTLAQVQKTARTPVLATLLVAGLILVFALALPLVKLAELTSFLVLLVFAAVNVALIVIKRRERVPKGAYAVALWVPVTGVVTALGLLIVAWALR
jgi:basic amino acid/polyamine antiporter, APA family